MTLPAIDTVATYGGIKYNAGHAEDYTTDRDASYGAKALASGAQLTRLAIRAWVRFNTTGLVGPGDHNAVWGNDESVKPLVVVPAYPAAITVTWPTTVTDLLGVSHTVSFRTGWVSHGWYACNVLESYIHGRVTVSGGVASITGINLGVTASSITVFLA